jgi:hypothetical protein
MSEIPYGFAKPLAIQIRNLVRQQGQTGGGFNKNLENRRVAIALTPTGGIPARSTTTPGTASCTLCKIDDTGDIATTSVTETVYNIEGVQVQADAYVVVVREYISGKWVVSEEEIKSCDDAPITDLRIDGNNLQFKRCGEWVTWATGTDCPEV